MRWCRLEEIRSSLFSLVVRSTETSRLFTRPRSWYFRSIQITSSDERARMLVRCFSTMQIRPRISQRSQTSASGPKLRGGEKSHFHYQSPIDHIFWAARPLFADRRPRPCTRPSCRRGTTNDSSQGASLFPLVSLRATPRDTLLDRVRGRVHRPAKAQR